MSQTVTPSRTPSPLERDVLYGRPLNTHIYMCMYACVSLSVSVFHCVFALYFVLPVTLRLCPFTHLAVSLSLSLSLDLFLTTSLSAFECLSIHTHTQPNQLG